MEEMNHEMTEVMTIERGDTVTGKVTKVEDKQAYIDIGYKYDGILPIGEVSAIHIDKVSDVIAEGESHEFRVIRINDDEEKLILSKRAVDSEKAWDELEEKMAQGEIIETTVSDVVKGGLVVDLGVRGFIPASLVERHFVEDFSDYKGRSVRLKVIELDKSNNKLILSQKAVLDEEAEAVKQERLAQLVPGEEIEGTVQRLTDFGAFVDVGGVDGLVHVSELSWQHVGHPSEVLTEGEQVKVKVLKVDPENERISLSIKETMPGPWSQVEEKLQVGEIVDGTVKRLVHFGAFVEVIPGVEGLVHISQIAHRHIGTPHEVLDEGQEVKVKILDIDVENERISLSIREAGEDVDRNAPEQYEMEEDDQNNSLGITLGDMFGDQLRKLK